MNESGLVIGKLHKNYPTRSEPLVVLAGIDLAVDYGQSVAIVGPSGSGKSTLLHIIGTLDKPSGGTVRVDGCDPFGLDDRELAAFRNASIGFVFQDHHLLPQCSALENVLIPTLAPRRKSNDRRNLGNAKNGAESRARELLQRVGLSDRTDHLPSELSGGERQRVAIARALINKPRLLLADEPTGNLDHDIGQKIGDLLVELYRAERTMLIVVTHSPAIADRMDRRFELRRGQLAEPHVPPHTRAPA